MLNHCKFGLLRMLFLGLCSCSILLASDNYIVIYANDITGIVLGKFIRKNQDGFVINEKIGVFRERIRHINNMKEAYILIKEFINSLGEQHSSYFTPEEVDESGISDGIGITVAPHENIIVRVFKKSSADDVGLKIGDKIVAINGINLDENSDFPKLYANSYKIAIKRPGILRIIEFYIVKGKFQTKIDPIIDVVSKINSEIGYIELTSFENLKQESSNEYVDQIINRIKVISKRNNKSNTCGWIIDLRRNLGGDFGPMIKAMGSFLGIGKVFSGFIPQDDTRNGAEFKEEKDYIIKLERGDVAVNLTKLPVAILQSQLTASAAEGVAISFIGRKNTRSFGEKTFGVPTINKPFTMKDRAILNLTVAFMADRYGWKYDAPIPPDQEVKINWLNIENRDKDIVVNTALKWLHTRPPCVKK